MKKRLLFLAAFIILTVIEILIGKYAGGFVRGYVGDMIVTAVVYTLVRVVFPDRFRYLCVGVFLFAVSVEIMQAVNIAEIMGITNPIIRTAIGTKFDVMDILCYAVGCLATGIFEIIYRKRMSAIYTDE